MVDNYKCNGEEVKLVLCRSGAVLTKGAVGRQPNGELLDQPCIPPRASRAIRDAHAEQSLAEMSLEPTAAAAPMEVEEHGLERKTEPLAEAAGNPTPKRRPMPPDDDTRQPTGGSSSSAGPVPQDAAPDQKKPRTQAEPPVHSRSSPLM